MKKSQRELARESRQQRLDELQNAARLMMLGRGATLADTYGDGGETPQTSEISDLEQKFLSTYPWANEYVELCDQYEWRVAAYIAWASAPIRYRTPATHIEFAELIDRSTRAIRQWLEKDPSIVEAIKLRQAAPLFAHRRDIYNALMAAASTNDPSCHADRKLALEMLGDYVPRSKKEITAGAGFSVPFTSDEFAQAAIALDAWEAQMLPEPAVGSEPAVGDQPATDEKPTSPETEIGDESA